ncbi:glycosyl hydrolase family 79 C-terminal domain-containing protein [Acidobacterium sp. S8]|uniref:glycosyl hydrolase family 79 C-terminal domain-containing protein n=1 Tax=Acidobacterium sp. S8 TaxID=1641854 RepID=UPI00131ACD0D|nr:glycosyl hydrolase family 79 C-terminal domain-containing protein [Acidobacterium sp. S8]
MHRRTFLTGLASATACTVSQKAFGTLSPATLSGNNTIPIHFDPAKTLGSVSANFVGLGYEISSVSAPGLLSAANRSYVQFVRTLGANGVIRIGGNTSDYSSFDPHGQPISSPKASVVTEANLEELGTFLKVTGWQLIWGLNLGKGSEQEAVDEAKTVSATAGDSLLAFEIGNEPDLFSHEGHRPQGYSYENYLADFRRYKQAVRASLPHASFAGPDAAGHTDWVTRFAQDEGSDLKLLTHHYYREGQNPFSTLDKLLNPDLHLETLLEKLKQASLASHLPYRICETNSFSGGGRPGVSDTFGAALWVLDYMFTLASAGAAGVNLETGINQLNFISSYSPIGDNGHGIYTASPPYYGMLAFAQAAKGQLAALKYETSGVNFRAYATVASSGRSTVTIINKDHSQDTHILLTTSTPFRRARVLRLTAPSLESKDSIQLGNASVSPDGTWRSASEEIAKFDHQGWSVPVPAGSAAVVQFES